MVSSASQASTIEAPEVVLSKDDYYQQYMRREHPTWSARDIGSYNDANFKFAKFFGDPSRNKFESEYEAYLQNVNNRNEAKAVQSARSWDEYMSNTAYSRAFADLDRSGINPYLLLNSGSSPATSVGSASKGSYSQKSMQETKSNNRGRDFALILLAIARLAAAM